MLERKLNFENQSMLLIALDKSNKSSFLFEDDPFSIYQISQTGKTNIIRDNAQCFINNSDNLLSKANP